MGYRSAEELEREVKAVWYSTLDSARSSPFLGIEETSGLDEARRCISVPLVVKVSFHLK